MNRSSRTALILIYLSLATMNMTQSGCGRKKRSSPPSAPVVAPAPAPAPTSSPQTEAPAAATPLSDEAMQTKFGTQSLLEIARRGDPTAIEWKIRQGSVDLRARNEEGLTALMIASRYGHSRAAAALLRAGAEVNAVGTGDVQPDLRNEKFADLLGPFRKIDARGMSALFWAQRAGHDDVVEVLLEGGADPNHRTETGLTPLTEAAKWGHGRQIVLLLAKGARVNDPGESDWRPIHWASARDKVDALNELLKANPDLTATTPDGKTALHLGAASGPRCLEGVLRTGTVNVNARDGAKLTPLMVAARDAQKRQVRALLEAQADADAKVGIWGFRKTALDFARENLENERKSLAQLERDLPQGNRESQRTRVADLEEIVSLLEAAKR